jgi:hypothetical protein
MKLEFLSRGVAILAIGEIIGCIKTSRLTTNVATVSAFVPAVGDLARMLISVVNQGEYTEGQRECARRKARK